MTASRRSPALDASAALAQLSRLTPDFRGKANAAWRLMHWLEDHRRLYGTWNVPTPDGARFELPRQSPMAWAMAFHGSYDAAVREIVMEYIEPGTLVLDIGASLGLWTIPLARRSVATGARLWAFEPHPNNHPWLRGNIRINGLESAVTVHAIALGDEPGTVTMDLGEAGLPGGGGNSAIAVDPAAIGVNVPIIALDSIPRTARVSVIKIDVEGYELRALRGARRLIEQDRPVIFGEFHSGWLRRRGEDPVAFLDEMRDLGYQVFAVEGLRTRPWRSIDATRLRLLDRGQASDDLLLRPLRS